VLKTLFVIVVGFLPSLFSLWMIRKSRMRLREAELSRSRSLSEGYRESHLRQNGSLNLPGERSRSNPRSLPGDRYYLEGVGYLVGDISCQYNARSGYIRCAVNPSGPCQDCRFYEPREMASSEKNFKQ
jgi:Family of unknown function (DUF6464)